jgi:hypothetical protein
MTRLIAILLLLSFALPIRVYAGLDSAFDPVEQNLIQKKQLEEDMSREFRKPETESIKSDPKKEEGGSNWWKWALGVLVVGGIAAAAGGGGGGGSAAPAPAATGTGSVSSSW